MVKPIYRTSLHRWQGVKDEVPLSSICRRSKCGYQRHRAADFIPERISARPGSAWPSCMCATGAFGQSGAIPDRTLESISWHGGFQWDCGSGQDAANSCGADVMVE